MENSITTLCRDVSRLTSAGDLLSQAGTYLMRKSPRATLWTAGISSSGFLSNFIGLNGFTAMQAVAAPLIVGSGMLSLGACLKFIPSKLWRQLEDIAQANDLNLMEDYRKSLCVSHLNLLWDKVFSYEARLHYTPQAQQEEHSGILEFKDRISHNLNQWSPDILTHLGAISGQDKADLVLALVTERPLSCNLEKSREGFLISSLYAMRHAMAQSTQTHTIGFRLNLYEDYCDGACFDKSDDMLFQQFKGHTCLTDIKKQAHFSGLKAILYTPSSIGHRLWFTLVTRKVSAGVGRAVRSLNQTYETDRFNAQVLLWPGEEHAEWLKSMPNAKQEILTLRRQILQSALGSTYENAEHVLNRMLLPGLKQAMDLRMLFDYEYCDQSLDCIARDTQQTITDHALADLKAIGCQGHALEKKQAFLTQAVSSMASFMTYLKSSAYASVLEDAETLRAVKIMFHSNQDQIHKLFKTPETEEARQRLPQLIRHATDHKTQTTCRLMAIRMHCQLAQLQIQEYKTLVKTLGYDPS